MSKSKKGVQPSKITVLTGEIPNARDKANWETKVKSKLAKKMGREIKVVFIHHDANDFNPGKDFSHKQIRGSQKIISTLPLKQKSVEGIPIEIDLALG